MIKANFKLLTSTAKLPSYAYDDNTNSGMDLYSDEDKIIHPKDSAIISLGISWYPEFDFSNDFNLMRVNFDFKYDGQQDFVNTTIKIFTMWYTMNHKIEMHIRPRSGLSFKSDVETGAGTVDSGFRGEFKVHLYNNGYEKVIINRGDKIAQGVVDAVMKSTIAITTSIPESIRGDKGYGSSGNN